MNIATEKTGKLALKCLIIDDESIAAEGVVNYAEKIDALKVVATCSCALEAIEVLKSQEIDLMFLDINMPDLSGLEFLETIDNPPMTIFTTAYSEYALDGFRLNAVDYLLKPYSFKRFFQAVQKAMDLYESRLLLQKGKDGKTTGMYIRQGDSFQHINWQDILYVESMQNYLKLHFKERSFVIHQTMTSLEDMLPKEVFFRIHKSYLVNTSHIETISGGCLYVNGKELPVSKYRREDLMNSVVYKNLISK